MMLSSSEPESDEDLFGSSNNKTHETIETLPLYRNDQDDDSEFETMATLPLQRPNTGTQSESAGRLTQPTQIIRRSPPREQLSPSYPSIQVAASSPAPTPVSIRKGGILASAMAPAGTSFARPFVPPQPKKQPVLISSDDEGPVYRGGSSDEDLAASRRNDIKTTTFQKSKPSLAEKIPESPARGHSLFKQVLSNAHYQEAPKGIKRSPDPLTAAYDNVSKKPRQSGPARALPVSPSNSTMVEDMSLDDIVDYNDRQKVKRMFSMLPNNTVAECYDMLKQKKFVFDDALEGLVSENERRQNNKGRTAIDLTGSDDELMPTPAVQKKAPLIANPVKQQAKAPQKSIAEKWSSTQNVNRSVPKRIDVFDTPPKKRTLIRGRKEPSSPPLQQQVVEKERKKPLQVISDESDQGDSGIQSDVEADASVSVRVLKFFNECTAADLADTAAIKPAIATHIISQRPFKSMAAVRRIESPDAKPSKSRSKAVPIGEKIADKVEEMIDGYEAVDYLVKKCENIAKPLTAEMTAWGVNIHGSQNGELEMVSLHESQISSHDSGIGTPVSDDDRDVKKPTNKKYFRQPSIMADDIKMKDYQIVGMNWLNLLYKKELSCILADDMGLGKTCQVIAFLAHLLETGEKGPHLVVVPAATLENWLKEFQRFCPKLSVEPYYSTNPSERSELRYHLDNERDHINVIVTTYTLAKGKEDQPWLKNFGFICTIFDEGHVLKNADAAVSRKLVRIGSKFRLLLTGTPLQNNLRELISLLAFLLPKMFKEKENELGVIFKHHVKAMDDNHDALLSAQRIARARSMLTPFILRRKKHQVLKDLPKKERRVEYCELTPEQTEIYHKWLRQAYDVRERRERGEVMGSESANILMKLRQASIHPFLFRRLYRNKQLPKIAKQCLKVDLFAQSNPDLIVTELDAYSDMEIHKLCDTHAPLHRFALNNHEWLASGKIKKMLELLRLFISQGHRTLIFSQFVMVLDILELVLEREAIAYFRLDGNTKVSERQDLIDEFCSDENTTPVFMLSTKAGGAGINLAKANKVIVFDSGFNPQDDIQAENRAHRIGQTKEVEVVRLVTKGTVEEQIYAMGLTKLKLDEQVAGDGTEEQLDGTGKKEGAEETDKEQQGRKMVEEMFFKKLEQVKAEDVKDESITTGASKELDDANDTDDDSDQDDMAKDKQARTKKTNSPVKKGSRTKAPRPKAEYSDEDEDSDLSSPPESDDLEELEENLNAKPKLKMKRTTSGDIRDMFLPSRPKRTAGASQESATKAVAAGKGKKNSSSATSSRVASRVGSRAGSRQPSKSARG